MNYFNDQAKIKLKKTKIIDLAKKVGFDVPISLEKRNTFLTGKDAQILRLNKKFRLDLLIIYPNIICSTKKIYQKNKKMNPNKSQFFLNIKNNKKLIHFLKNNDNDLEQIVIKIYPKIKKIIDYIKLQKGCLFSRITGSGSACIGIFSSRHDAIYAQKLIRAKYPKYWCVVSKTI